MLTVLRLACATIMIGTGVFADGLDTELGRCRACFGVFIAAIALTEPPKKAAS